MRGGARWSAKVYLNLYLTWGGFAVVSCCMAGTSTVISSSIATRHIPSIFYAFSGKDMPNCLALGKSGERALGVWIILPPTCGCPVIPFSLVSYLSTK